MPGLHIDITADNTDLKKKLDDSRQSIKQYTEEVVESGETAQRVMDSEYAKILAAQKFYGTKTRAVEQSTASEKKEIQKVSDAVNELSLSYRERAKNLIGDSGGVGNALKIEQGIIAQMEADYKALNAEVQQMNDGISKDTALKELSQVKKDIEDEKILLSQLNAELKNQSETEEALRTQILKKKEDLSKLTFGTEEYVKVAKELGALQDKMAITNAQGKIYSDQYQNVTLAKEAIQGLTGALTIGTAVSSMFNASQENIERIQMRLQQVMAITMGVQQISVVLNKTSYVRTLLLVKAKNLLSAAELRLATAMNISAKAAKGMLAALTGGISLAIYGIISAFQSLSKENSNATKSFEAMQNTFVDSFGKSMSSYKSLVSQYSKLGDTLQEKEKFIRENQKAFNDLSLSVKSVSDADYLFISGTDNVVKALQQRAMAAAYTKQMQEKYDAIAKSQFEIGALNKALENDFEGENVPEGFKPEVRRQTRERITNLAKEINDSNKDIAIMQEEANKAMWESTKVLDKGSTNTTISLLELTKQLKLESVKTKQAIDDANNGKISQEALQEQQKKLNDLKTLYQSRTGVTWDGQTKRKSQDKKDVKDYNAEYQKQTEELEQAAYERGLAIREAEVKGMEDGLDKLLAQNDLDFEKQIHQIDEQNKQVIDKLNESYKVKWEQKGNDANGFSIEKYLAKYPEEVQKYNDEVTKINVDYQKQEELLLKNYNSKNAEETKDYLNNLYGEYKGYLVKRKDIEEKYDEIEKGIKKEAPEAEKESSIAEAEYKKQVELESLDSEFAQREQAYRNWLSSISNLSIKSLEIMLAKAKETLAKLESEGSTDGKALAKARAEIVALETEIGKAKLDPQKRTFKQWDELSEAIGHVASQFSAIGDAVGGTEGEMLKSASTIATTTLGMINSIQQLSTTSQAATLESAETTSKAIKAVEKASIILSIIAAAIQLLQSISDMIPDSYEQYEKYAAEIKEINQLTQAVDAYNIALQKSKATREGWFGADSLKSLRDYKDLQQEVLKAYYDKIYESQAIYQNKSGGGWLTSIWRPFTEFIDMTLGKVYGFEINKDYKEGQTAAMNNLRIETRKSSSGIWGSGVGGHSQRTKDLQTWINEKEEWKDAKLFDDMGFINKELAQTILDKYSDKLVGETKETLEALVELKNQYDEYIEQLHDYVAQMYEPLVENFTDALWDWFDSGKDALDSFKEYASDTFRDIVTDMMKTIVLDKVVKGYQDDIAKLYEKYSTGELSEEELMKQVSALTSDLMNRYETQIPVLQDMMQNITSQIKQDTGIDVSGDANREASEKGIAQASQDTVDELNGRITVIQSHTYEINATTKAMLQNSNVTLSHLANIESNTARLIGIETDIHSVKSALEDINTRGILLR